MKRGLNIILRFEEETDDTTAVTFAGWRVGEIVKLDESFIASAAGGAHEFATRAEAEAFFYGYAQASRVAREEGRGTHA